MFSKVILTGRSVIAAVVLSATVCACTPAQKQTTLQIVTEINTRAPEVVAAADTVAATLSALLPTDAALIGVASTAFDTCAATIQTLAASYIKSPNASVMTRIQNAITTLESLINTATLNAVDIKDTTKQQILLAALKGLLTVVTALFAIISPTLSTAQLTDLREEHQIQLARVRPYMDEKRLSAELPGVDLNAAFAYAAERGL